MGLSTFLKDLFSSTHVEQTSRLQRHTDVQGMTLELPPELHNQAAQGNADNLALHQYLRMQMLLEEGVASPREHGIFLPAADCVALDSDSRHVFGLPPRWAGKFRLLVKGVSRSPDFALQLHLQDENGEWVRRYELDGPLLELSESEVFLPDPPQWQALQAVARHQALPARNEYHNLAAIHAITKAAEAGLNIERAAFTDFNTAEPENISLAVEIQPDGSLELMPAFGCDLAQDEIQQRLGQIAPESGAQSLRVGKTIVLLDEDRLRAAHEIIRKRHVPASQRRKFFAAPASYLDAALVNLDAGFSVRIKGAGPFLHAYFGETDATDINWFDQSRAEDIAADLLEALAEPEKNLVQPADLPSVIKDPAVLGDFKQKFEDAKQTNATVLRLEEQHFDISDTQRVHDALIQLEDLFQHAPPAEDVETIAIDIHLNDMEADFGEEINAPAKGHRSQVELDFGPYTRSPFPHQVEGVRWMLGLALDEGQPLGPEHRIQGGLLADDMGLGKTYMSIVGIREMLIQAKWEDKPVLVVAPLSLLENWKREIQSTYKEPFFNRFVVLQSDGDLDKFRLTGRSVETKRRKGVEVAGALFSAEGGTVDVALAEGHEGLFEGEETTPLPFDHAQDKPAPPTPEMEGTDIPPWEEAPESRMGRAERNPSAAEDGFRSALPILPVETDMGTPEKVESPLPFTPELKKTEEEDLFALQRSLKIGPEWGPDRLDLPGTLVLATYQSLRDYQFSLASIPWSVVVFDEAQNVKSPNTLQTRAAKALNAEFKLMVTGTPVENHLGELWCLFDTMQPGFLGSYQDFRQEYIKPILRATPDELNDVREEVGQQLRDRVGGFMLRRNKEDHLDNMPEKFIVLGEHDSDGKFVFDPRITTEMKGGQRLRYEDVMQGVINEMQSGEAFSAALRGLQQLRDVSLFPGLVGEMPPPPANDKEARALFEQSGKLSILLRLLEEIRKRGEKVLVFVVNKRLQELVAMTVSRLYGIRVAIINGETKAVSNNPNNPTRQSIIDHFQAEEGFRVLVISPVAAGVGLTITAANHVVHLERHWNPAKEAQATDRAYRIGQTKDVYVYIPILTHPDFDSFDVNLNRLLMSKMSLKDAIITQEEVHTGELVQSGVFGKISA